MEFADVGYEALGWDTSNPVRTVSAAGYWIQSAFVGLNGLALALLQSDSRKCTTGIPILLR